MTEVIEYRYSEDQGLSEKCNLFIILNLVLLILTIRACGRFKLLPVPARGT